MVKVDSAIPRVDRLAVDTLRRFVLRQPRFRSLTPLPDCPARLHGWSSRVSLGRAPWTVACRKRSRLSSKRLLTPRSSG